MNARDVSTRKLRLLFVVEAGFEVGLGHLLRCRVLMQALRAQGHAVDLWLYGDKAALEGRDWPHGMQLYHCSAGEQPGMVCSRVEQLLRRGGYDWLVVDGYAFSSQAHVETLKSQGHPLLLLDDLANREVSVDIILNQNTSDSDLYDHGQSKAGQYLLGPQYALIDPVYCLNRGQAGKLPADIQRVLVTFGGVDRRGRTLRVVELLNQYYGDVEIVVVAGPYFPFLVELESMSERIPLRIEHNVRDLSQLMRQCDLMITAGGSTVWQACCCGVPMLVFQTVDNQCSVIETLQRSEAALCLSAVTGPDQNAGIQTRAFIQAYEVVADATVRMRLVDHAIKLVDGNGASRVAVALESWGVTSAERG